MFSDPVVGDKFFGRRQVLDLLAKRVNALTEGYRQNIAIIGPQLIGKSSLILQAFANFSHHKVIPIYIELLPNSFKHFVYKWLGTLLYHYLKTRHQQIPTELQLLKNEAQRYIPDTVEMIHRIESSVKNLQFDQAFENLLSLTAVLKKESGISSIVILDEFHLLDTFRLKAAFAGFAKEIMLQKDTMYILLSSQISYAKKILAAELSLLFGNFEIIRLEPFDYATSCQFLEQRFQDIDLPKSLRDFLVVFSGRNPFYLDILTSSLKEKAKEFNQTRISPDLISQSFNTLIYDSKGILNQYFTNLLSHNLNGADYSQFVPILVSCTAKGVCLSDLVRKVKRQPKILTKQISHLLDKDLLSKVGAFYRIQDKVFRLWLKSAYQRKRLSLAADPVSESKGFCKEIEGEISAFSKQTKGKLIEGLLELFKSFNNEIVAMQNKSFKFFQFEEVRPIALPELGDCVLARYQDKYWLALVKRDGLAEMHVQKLANFCLSSKLKIQRAIIISGKEIELNVRLVAMEKKIWIWQPADLNLLLDLYGKQQIVDQFEQ